MDFDTPAEAVQLAERLLRAAASGRVSAAA
jgi:hypothetical protein